MTIGEGWNVDCLQVLPPGLALSLPGWSGTTDNVLSINHDPVSPNSVTQLVVSDISAIKRYVLRSY